MDKSSERLVVIRNPACSHAKEVQGLVVDRLREGSISKNQLAEFWTPSPDSTETIEALSEFMQPGDRIIVAAGDGTGNAAANAYMQVNSEGAQLGFLPYGNFNDMAATFTGHSVGKDPIKLLDRSRPTDAYPLEITKNGEHYRYALLYATLGWTARAAATFDNPAVRKGLQQGKANIAVSLYDIAKMYFKTRDDSKLPPFRRVDPEGQTTPLHGGVTDILAVNGPIMAKIIRSHQAYYESGEFLSSDLDVSRFFANISLLGRSALNLLLGTKLKLPGATASKDVLQFESAAVPIQVDGEYSRLNDVNEVAISKNQSPAAKPIQVMSTGQ